MKSTMMKGSHPAATYDPQNHRFIIKPLLPNGMMTLPNAFRAIKQCRNALGAVITWKFLANFCKISQSDAFKVCYTTKRNNCVVRKALEPYLVVDAVKGEAYLYDFDHKPEDAKPEHFGPKMENGEAESQGIIEKIPSKVTSRVRILYPFSQSLMMTLKPTNGYLLGIKDIVIAQPNATYKVAGSASSLSELLQRMHFVAMEPGDASLLISVDDGAGVVGSVASTTVKMTVEEGEKVSVPELILPESPKATLNEESKFDAIKVVDADDKMMQFRISPFGCKIINFKNTVHPLVMGQVRNINGRPDTINEDIANLSIIPYQANASIGIELICGLTTIRQYLVFDVAMPATDEPDEGEEGSTESEPSTPEAGQEPAQPAKAAAAPSEPVAQNGDAAIPAETPQVTFTAEPNVLDLAAGAVAPFTPRVETATTDEIEITLKPIRCTLTNTDDNSTTVHNKTLTLKGTPEQINAILAKMQVTAGTKDGRVDMTAYGATVILPVNIVAAQ